MLVTRVLGPCPQCGYHIFGNVQVVRNVLIRGCGRCTHHTEHYLPDVRKQIVYLDQCLFSAAFKRKDPRVLALFERVDRLAHMQLLASPRSRIHEAETAIFIEGPDLLEFIKRTSRGHEFEPPTSVEHDQVVAALLRQLKGEATPAELEREEAIDDKIHLWDDYFRVEIRRSAEDADAIRAHKAASFDQLFGLFDAWRAQKISITAAIADVHAAVRSEYVQELDAYARAVVGTDLDAFRRHVFASPLLQRMRYCFPAEVPVEEAIARSIEFLNSTTFAELPLQRIRAGMIARLRMEVQAGAYVSRENAFPKLRGFHQDLGHMATYGPYCDAVVVDSALAEALRHPAIALERRYGTKVFTVRELAPMHAWLDEIEQSPNDYHRNALRWVYGGEHQA